MEELIKRIEAIADEHPYKVVEDTDTYSQYNEAWTDACDRILSVIQSSPNPCDNCIGVSLAASRGITDMRLDNQSSQSDGWIPVSSETNPKKSDIYLATFEENGNRYVERFYYSEFVGWMMPVSWQDEGRIDNLIAWQPLPAPYNPQR